MSATDASCPTTNRRYYAEPVHDATLLAHGGLHWLLAAGESEDGSSWDALNLYAAPALLGLWQAHATNPVLVDAASARPAGAIRTATARR